MRTRPRLLLAAGLLAVTGCSFSASIGGSSVPASELEEAIPDLLSGALSGDVIEVDCDGGLDAEVDALTECVVSGKGLEYDVEVVATRVVDDTVDYEVEPTSEIRGAVEGEFLAENVSEQLSQQIGRPPESVECPDGLVPEVDETIRCELFDSGQTYGVTVTVSAVQLANFNFDILVDQEPS